MSSFKGLPEFYQQGMSWLRRDWAGKKLEFKTWFMTTVDPISSGITYGATIYTVPSGRRFYYTESHLSAEFRGRLFLHNTYRLHFALVEPYQTSIKNASIPLPTPTGKSLRISIANNDNVAGRPELGITGWEEPASTPEKPKNNSPFELYRTGQFNYCEVLILDKETEVFIFNKYQEDKFHYLEVKNFGEKNQKILNSCDLSLKQGENLTNIIHSQPEKIKENLNKIK